MSVYSFQDLESAFLNRCQVTLSSRSAFKYTTGLSLPPHGGVIDTDNSEALDLILEAADKGDLDDRWTLIVDQNSEYKSCYFRYTYKECSILLNFTPWEELPDKVYHRFEVGVTLNEALGIVEPVTPGQTVDPSPETSEFCENVLRRIEALESMVENITDQMPGF